MKKTALIFGLFCLCAGPFLPAQSGHSGAVNDISFHPGGDVFASCSDDGTIIVWDLQEGAAGSRIEAHDDYALCLDYSPDGKQLISGGADYEIALWDAVS